MDDQITAATDRQSKRPGLSEAPADEVSSETAVLRLARAKTLQDLQHACDRRHRATLERALEHLDAEIAKLA